tara:strand:- start:51 stop:227 length:177 start_codon:yes stop_codon:yes gene_type:complete
MLIRDYSSLRRAYFEDLMYSIEDGEDPTPEELGFLADCVRECLSLNDESVVESREIDC